MESTVSLPTLFSRLSSHDDSARKLAIFKLQALIGDPSFADSFLAAGGLPKLVEIILTSNGNALAYALTSFARLLELDKGWEGVDKRIIERAVQLVVTQPLVNILRSAVLLLVAVVSHPAGPGKGEGEEGKAEVFGFRALNPAVKIYPQFLEMLVSMLSSAEHLLCANALQLINSLVRDVVTNDAETEWPKFIKKLQDLGVIKAVYFLMQGQALQDLAQPLLEFQSLTKIMLRKWRDVRVDLEKTEHKRALRSVSAASYQEDERQESGSRRHKDPERWRRVGFETETPGTEFDETGFLGMMDLTDYVMKNEDLFRKLVLEQSTKLPELRVPIAKASLAVTQVLYEHFDIDAGEADDAIRLAVLENRANFEKAFKPLLLHWSRLHTAGLNAFLRLWKATGAEVGDFEKIVELLRILIEQVVGLAERTKDISEAEVEMVEYDYRRLRELQMELLQLSFDDAWGRHLKQVKDELQHEALEFMKEQRIRCLLAGAWFPHTQSNFESGPVTKTSVHKPGTSTWRFVRLSHNRRFLHYLDFPAKTTADPSLNDLTNKIDLSMVSSVVSNVSTTSPETVIEDTAEPATSAPPPQKKGVVHFSPDPTPSPTANGGPVRKATISLGPPSSLPAAAKPFPSPSPATRITIHGYTVPSSKRVGGAPTSASSAAAAADEQILLTLLPATHSLASEWLDGLLMLLNQAPITAETLRLMQLVREYGLKIRLLNVGGKERGGRVEMPGREGVDEEFWFDVAGV